MVVLPPLFRLSSPPHVISMHESTFCDDHALQRCAVFGCVHFAKLHGVCLLHDRQETVRKSSATSSSPTCSIASDGHRASKRRNKKCQLDRCQSFARSGGFCTRHGGGRKCKVDGCNTASQTGGLCRIHGGGSKCKVDQCDQFARSRGMCLPHSRSHKAE